MRHLCIVAGLIPVLAAAFAGCERGGESPAEPVRIRLATTTSTENSGLLDALLPAFRRESGIEVLVLSMGTGKALATAANGDADVVLVHAPAAEKQFVAAGHGVDRTPVMYNDFVILGPPADPAGVKGKRLAAEAMRALAAAKATFISRGDNSGTHKKETALWAAARVAPAGAWYLSVGKGMGDALVMADEKRAYILADRGTYLKLRDKIDLRPLVEGDRALHNPYHVIAVNPRKHPNVNHAAAKRFIDYLTADRTRQRIAAYTVAGEALFHPWGL